MNAKWYRGTDANGQENGNTRITQKKINKERQGNNML